MSWKVQYYFDIVLFCLIGEFTKIHCEIYMTNFSRYLTYILIELMV